jgi:hypothetical protein
VIPIVQEGNRNPLGCAAELSERTWAPTVNPANMLWLDTMAERARSLGSSHLFMGSNGNAAFSFEHSYAARFHAGRGELGALLRLVRQGHAGGLPWPKAIRYRMLSPLLAPLRSRLRRSPPASYGESIGLGALGSGHPERPLERSDFLAWLRADSGLHLVLQPTGPGALPVDPFCDAQVLALAAAITPVEWCRGPYPRGYARLLGEGRVPDAIRLRTRRGGQSWDGWFLIRNQRERYLDEIDALASNSLLGPVVDLPFLKRKLEAWPWGRIQGPGVGEVNGIDRLLSLAGFVRRTEERLRDLRRSQTDASATLPP